MWEFWIDVGGTFTDCIGVAPSGAVRQFKTLSSGVTKGTPAALESRSFADAARRSDPDDFWTGAICRVRSQAGTVVAESLIQSFEASSGRLTLQDELPSDFDSYELLTGLPAPVLAVRWLLGLGRREPCPPVRMRFGTTRGTNALLTRTGARTALITTRGFADVPQIGNQDRPDLFDLNIRKPSPLFGRVFDIDERISADGAVLKNLDVATELERLRADGLTPDIFDSVAICLLNSYANTVHEERLEAELRRSGFNEISRSTEVSPLIRFVPRCDTTILDAYLNPVLRKYLDEIRGLLPGSRIQVMTSVGGLVDSTVFRGRDCVLSGPAGGIVGFARVAADEGFAKAIGFDMGGTSTDVARFDGRFELENETEKAGVRIMTPMLAIETVAAGGGSICGFDGTRLRVGPQSAGADPGPACYGSGGPLTVTDLNLFLGRILPQHFPFRLDPAAVRNRLEQLRSEMAAAGVTEATADLHQLAEGLLQIANDNMVQAIRKVSVAKGYHPTEHALVCFGGAGGQHACSIARSLSIARILIHPFAGILSAYGMGRADVRAIRQTSVLAPLSDRTLSDLGPIRDQFAQETATEVMAQGITAEHIQAPVVSLELRYAGTDSSLMIAESDSEPFQQQFENEHRRLFGFIRPDATIEIATLRLETTGTAAQSAVSGPTERSVVSKESAHMETVDVFFSGRFRNAVVRHRDSLQPGDTVDGPSIICEATSTTWVEPGCRAEVTSSGTLSIEVTGDDVSEKSDAVVSASSPDPVQLEVFSNQFVSIAEQMGETLRRTSTSTNVRERLDFSCALFDADGRLVVNAPHVPVHLGAMGETVQSIMKHHPTMKPGDVFVTNDPFRGGSHLPDVTVITPVFTDDRMTADLRPDFFVANRAHHAEIGGIAPGSMPPFSTSLADEGVLIRSRLLIHGGQSCESEIRTLLESGDFPSRSVDDNLADLAAQAAANTCGANLLCQLAQEHSAAVVQQYMRHLQSAAADRMRLCLTRLGDRAFEFEDYLDDGSRIRVAVTVADGRATVDFSGTAPVHAGNLNANRAITTAAVLYSFRCLLNEDVALNAGVLDPVRLVVPEGLLNPPAGESPADSPAVVGGNVETSQRIVDVLLGALGIAAASQGTMNNLTFGDDTFGYYETICGGSGATPQAAGAHAVHTHMTNTRLTDPEVLEQRYPVRLHTFGLRPDSGGTGQHRGGNGVIRELEFLKPLAVSMLCQRRSRAPYGLQGGGDGACGVNSLLRANAEVWQDVGGSFHVEVRHGDRLRIETPGGGAFGSR